MDRKTIFVLVVAVIINLFVASVVFSHIQGHYDFMAMSVPVRYWTKLYQMQFDFNIMDYTMKSFGSSLNKSKAKNSYFCFVKEIDKYKRVNIIIGYLDHVNYFSAKSVVFDSSNIYTKEKDNVNLHNVGSDWAWQFQYPPLVFNSRTIPNPGKLSINGLQIDSSMELHHKYTQEYRYIGIFSKIGFCVEDDSWLIKNIPVIFDAYDEKYGSLSFFITPEKKIAYMIFFVKEGTKEDYYKYINELEPALDSIKVFGFPDKYKK